MSFEIRRLGETITKAQAFEVVMPDGKVESFKLQDPYLTEEIIQRHASNRYLEWQFEQALAYEEKHYGIAIKRYSDDKVVWEGWAETLQDAERLVLERIAHSVMSDIYDLGPHPIEYFGIFPRIYTGSFGNKDYYQFERGDFRESED